jgi:hypothetical protein
MGFAGKDKLHRPFVVFDQPEKPFRRARFNAANPRPLLCFGFPVKLTSHEENFFNRD